MATKTNGSEICRITLFILSLCLVASNVVNLMLTINQCTSTNIGLTSKTQNTKKLPSSKWMYSANNPLEYNNNNNNNTRQPFPPYTDSMSCHYITNHLEHTICELEYSNLFYSTMTHPLVVAKDLSLMRYYAQRDLHGWSLAYKNISFDLTERNFKQGTRMQEVSVLLCLGIVSQDRFCLKPTSYRLLGQGQRINQIHGLRDTLWRKDAFCFTIREALRGYRGWSNFTFPCWVLPQDWDILRKEMSTKIGSEYIVKPAFRGEGHGIYVVRSPKEISHSSSENYVVQPFLRRPYLVRGRKFDFRTYVLVTSISPLRVYFYSEGLVRFASTKYNHNATRGGKENQYLTNTSVGKKFTSLANLTWTYGRLCRYLSKRNINTSKVFDSVRNAITRTLLTSEYRFLSDIKFNLGGYDCRHCYHLLGVDVILDEDLHPIVIEVNGLPSMQLSHELGVLPNPSSAYTATKYGLMSDMLHILYGNISVARELALGLETLKIGVGPGPLCDKTRHIYCIDMKTLQGLVAATRERYLSGNYKRMYPAGNGERYSHLIKHMHLLINKKFGGTEGDEKYRTLWQNHHLMTALEKLLL